MTKRGALIEARKRWGPKANVRVQTFHFSQTRLFQLTTPTGRGREEKIMGQGTTWEAAFADADRREKGEAW